MNPNKNSACSMTLCTFGYSKLHTLLKCALKWSADLFINKLNCALLTIEDMRHKINKN